MNATHFKILNLSHLRDPVVGLVLNLAVVVCNMLCNGKGIKTEINGLHVAHEKV